MKINPHAPFYGLVLLVDREASAVAAEIRARGERGRFWPEPLRVNGGRP